MKVLTLNSSDSSGGAARAAFRLHRGLRAIGIESEMLVQGKRSDDPSVIGPASEIAKKMAMLRPHLDFLPLRMYPDRQRIIFSPALVPDRLPARIAALNPDIVHLHWICEGFMRLETLPRLKRPIVWTLHDSWAFTGGCHIPFDCLRYQECCGECPTLGSAEENDLSRKIWLRKRKAWQGLNLTVVTPSNWLAACARSSSLFRDLRVEVIPNGLDLERFKPCDKTSARSLLRLPQDKKLILFGGVNVDGDRNKGLQNLLPALRRLACQGWGEKAEALVFGASRPADATDFGLPTRYLGILEKEADISLLYSAADVFVAPSIQENLPNTVMEAAACGTPSVAFRIGGMPDLIEHKRNGYLAVPYEPEDLADGIGWVLADSDRWQELSDTGRKKTEREFALPQVAGRYAALYEDIRKTGARCF
jgi:glycosyltransferase involved in cell wall biosynthesis